MLLLVRCNTPPAAEEESTIEARVPVEVTQMNSGVVTNELSLSASTMYLKRNVVTSTIPGFITAVNIKLGDPVKRGQLLYSLETKERRALGNQPLTEDSLSASFGKIQVLAPASGIVSTLDKQQIGDYILEGSQLCTIAESNELAFAVNVPFEYTGYTKPGTQCRLILPNNTSFPGHFTTPLTTMNALAQTQTILAKSEKTLFLPENLIVKVLVQKDDAVKSQVLPRAAILSDEMMQEFWVMKLLNDSIAVRINVKPGTMNRDLVEIVDPLFNADDLFLTSGNYGLPDTALVKVTH